MYTGAELMVRPKLERFGDSVANNSLFAVEQIFRNSLTTAAAQHCRVFASLTKQAEVSVLLEPRLQKHSSLCALMAGSIADLINHPTSATKQTSLVWFFRSASMQGMHPSIASGAQAAKQHKFLPEPLDSLSSPVDKVEDVLGSEMPTTVVPLTTLIVMIGGVLMINLWPTAHFIIIYYLCISQTLLLVHLINQLKEVAAAIKISLHSRNLL